MIDDTCAPPARSRPAILRELGSWARRGLDLVLPPRCLSCGVEVAATGTLCPDCWTRINFLGPPHCACCGLPFDYPVEDVSLCGACTARPPQYDRCRAVFAYGEESRRLVLSFKHGDRTDGAPGFGAWMARAGAELLEGADLLAPVPLHRWRLFHRRYNQSALLAQAVARLSGREAVLDLLVRRRRTPTQGGLSGAGRRRNVAGAFAVKPCWRERVKGARVLLLDDVYTTGATVEECARVLKRAGAAGVDVLTLARVVKPVRLDV